MSTKIKILHIQQTIGSGGVERRRLSLAKLLNKNVFEQKFICTQAIGNIPDEIRAEGFEVIPIGVLKSPFDWKQHKKVQKIIEEYQPDIIHGAVYEGVTMAAINGFIKKVPLVILEETSDPQNRSAKADFLLRIFSWIADRFIAIAPNVANYLINTAKIASEKVITINNGVEIPREVSSEEIKNLRNQYQIKPTDFVIGTVGRLFDDHKKITDIIAAIKILDNVENLKLLVVGGGRDEELIKQKAIDLGVKDKVIFTGYQFDTAPFYKLMNVFSIASQREGFGLVAAEAMLHHLPVIATKVGGLQNVVVHDETGILINPNQPKDIALAIRKLYNDPQLLDSFAEKGFKRAMDNYTEERYVKEVFNLYSELLKSKNIVQ